jgi:hypothetical protein
MTALSSMSAVPSPPAAVSSPASTPADRPRRSTPAVLRLWAGTTALAVCGLLGVSVTAFSLAHTDAATISSRAAVAAQASDLYFTLADLDSQAARLVLLGDGDLTPGDGAYAGDALAALTGYNTSAAQSDADLRALAAASGPQDTAALTALTSGMTTYHDLAASAVTLVVNPGSPAGQSAPAAIGYYSLAAALLKNVILPQAAALRESTAATVAAAASSARRTAFIAVGALALLGLLALALVGGTHRRLTRRFRRLVNPAMLGAGLLVLGLVGGGALALSAVATDSGAAATRFAGYLEVARVRADSYATDGELTRAVLIPGTDELGAWQQAHNQQTPLAAAISRVDADLAALGPVGGASAAGWPALTGADMKNIVAAAQSGDVATALTLDTGTHRGQAAFDFSFYDTGLRSLADGRLAAFHQATASISADFDNWFWLPEALSAAALILIAAGVWPRLSEFR